MRRQSGLSCIQASGKGVMSPILFSLFVNGLARDIKAVGKAGRKTESAVVVVR